MHEHKLPPSIHNLLSGISVYEDQERHAFSLNGPEILDQKLHKEVVKGWYSSNHLIKKHTELDHVCSEISNKGPTN